MRPPCFPLVAAAAVVVATAAMAAEWKLPSIEGELTGNVAALKLAGAPKLEWKLTMSTPTPGERRADLAADGPGTRLRIEARIDAVGDVEWKLVEARLDLAQWFPAIAAKLGADFAGISAAGIVEATGEGAWRKGVLGGRARIALREGRLDDPAHKLTLEGVTFDLAFEDLGKWRTAAAQTLAWASGRYDVITLGAGRIVFSSEGKEVEVAEASLAVFQGELALGRFHFPLDKPEFAVNARLTGAEVALFLPLLPPIVTAANGRLDGAVTLRRNASGLQIGAGRLSLRAGESAEVLLAPTPGLLSAALPENVKRHYPGLADLENGKVPLRAEVLEVTFTPDGDELGRTASVHLAGGPVDPRLRAPVDLTVNVRGPLDLLVKFGTDSRLHWGAR